MERFTNKLSLWAWPFILGIGAGMIILMYFGFVSSNTASAMAEKSSETMAVSILTPLCVEHAKADEAKLAEVLALSNYQRRETIAAAGWIPYPEGASTKLKRALEESCALGIAK